ncbi:MAG TPA: TlpA disulfide reductase family protein [Steroidobacteraceae bacterium]|nr:TlpA disulfide reductase family protein [Steroidobacteraceae bacterium]
MPSDAASQPAPARRIFLQGLAACLAGAALRPPSAAARGLRTGEAAPPATLVTLDGARISTAELRGEVVILTFWATWCTPCRTELPLLSDYLARHARDGLQILGFSLDTDEQLPDVRRVAQSLRFPVGLLRDSSAAGYGRIWRLPVSFTINRAGLLAEDGWKAKQASWTQERLERLVTPLLAQRG